MNESEVLRFMRPRAECMSELVVSQRSLLILGILGVMILIVISSEMINTAIEEMTELKLLALNLK